VLLPSLEMTVASQDLLTRFLEDQDAGLPGVSGLSRGVRVGLSSDEPIASDTANRGFSSSALVPF
jgi:hypothetical protein